jgi:predicted peptidase
MRQTRRFRPAFAVLTAGLALLPLARAADPAEPAQPGRPSTQPTAQPAAQPGGQTAQSFEMKQELKYLLYLPQDYGKEANKAWPLVLFLHGSGERGTDLEVVKKHGPPKLVAEGKQFPFILVSPQCPPNQWWDSIVLKGLVDDVQTRCHVDPDRVYVTGLSMGGFGTWDLARHYPQKFAAIAPICGGGDPQFARNLAHMPAWVFHGEDDHTVPIQRSEEMVEALKKAGDTDVKFTRYPGVGHDSWVKAYDDPQLYEWLLSHKRDPAAAERPK